MRQTVKLITIISAKYTYEQITNVSAFGSPTSKRRKEEYCYEFVALPVVSFLLLLCCCSGSIQRRRYYVGRTFLHAPVGRPAREPMRRDKFERTWSHAGHDLRNRTNSSTRLFLFYLLVNPTHEHLYVDVFCTYGSDQ